MPATLLPTGTRQRILVISASVGAGHDGAAEELALRLSAQGFRVDRHDFLHLLPGPLGQMLRRAYALQLRVAPNSWGQLFTALDRHRRLASAATALSGSAAARIRRMLPPDTAAVVSTYPLASQALGRLRRRGLLEVPAVTFLTDMSVHPLWVADGVDTHLAVHPVAAAQALRLGAADVHVTAPAVAAAFRPAASAAERGAARLRHGLPAGRPLALVVAGSWGTGDIERTVADLAATGLARPVVVCGRNAGLPEAIARSGFGIALGWVDDMPGLMRACDVVVQNAGGLSSLEALATGLPMISYRCLPGHGTTNAAALDRAGWAPWARRAGELPALLAAALAGRGAVSPWAGTDPAALIAGLVQNPTAVARPARSAAGAA